VRRRIKAGKISAFHDQRGRLRIRASVPPEAGQQHAPNLAEIWNELKTTKQNLATALSEARELQDELGLAHFHRREAQQEAQSLENQTAELSDELRMTREQLEHTQQELAALWRVMSARGERARQLADMTDGNEAFDLPRARTALDSERSRIQGQIARVRDLSKRRRWPWPQAS
jgi:chromosome segregation ATPase